MLALFAAAKVLPWKLIGLAAGALLIGLSVFAAYEVHQHTVSQLIQAQKDLAREEMLHQAEKDRADGYVTQHNDQLARLQTLEKERNEAASRSSELQDQIDSLNLQKEFDSDTAKALDALNARNADLNRVLNGLSAGKTPGDSSSVAGAKAGKAKRSSALQRALQGLR
jgi:septal ring factor EnvC (AmiA/AmiB activator)